MSLFSANEYLDMVLVYAQCGYNSGRAVREYAERYPKRRHPKRGDVIIGAMTRIRNNQPIVPIHSGGGPRPIPLKLEENILEHFRRQPHSSTRNCSRVMSMPVSHASVHKILKKHKQRPFTIKTTQVLQLEEEEEKVEEEKEEEDEKEEEEKEEEEENEMEMEEEEYEFKCEAGVSDPLTFTCVNLQSTMANKTALVILAEGAEEMETVITVDMLRRGGVTVTMAGLDSASPVLCSRKVTLVPDKSLSDALAEKPEYDAVILPGGLEGSDRLSKSGVVGTLLKEHEKSGKIVAAICAAPTAFVAHGVAKGKKVTSYPSTKDKIPSAEYSYIEGERVVVDGNIVTSRGPGTAYWFGLKLIEMLTGKDKADQVEKGMLISGY